MGTHPIFESDFDCLTEMLSRTLIRRVHLSRPVAGGAVEYAKPDFVIQWKKSNPYKGKGESGDRGVPSEECASDAPQIYGRWRLAQGGGSSYSCLQLLQIFVLDH